MRFLSAIFLLCLLLVAMTGRAQSTNATFSTGTINLAVPDANPSGLATTLNVSGMSGQIVNLTVSLNISGGFNGDLYAYLVSPTGTAVVLLDRVGVMSGSPFGYGNTGFNITLDSASGNNIHTYQSGSYSLNGNGQLTGTWAPDYNTVNPLSSPGAFNATSPSGTTLANLDGLSPNGNWTLFVADLSAGGNSTVVSWGLMVMTVPEPQTWTMLGGGMAALWFLQRRRLK